MLRLEALTEAVYPRPRRPRPIGGHVITRYIVDGSNLAHNGERVPIFARLVAAYESLKKQYPFAVITVCADSTLYKAFGANKSEQSRYDKACQRGEIVVAPPDVIGGGDGFILQLGDEGISNAEKVVIVSNDRFEPFHKLYPWLLDNGRVLRGRALTVTDGFRWSWMIRKDLGESVARIPEIQEIADPQPVIKFEGVTGPGSIVAAKITHGGAAFHTVRTVDGLVGVIDVYGEPRGPGRYGEFLPALRHITGERIFVKILTANGKGSTFSLAQALEVPRDPQIEDLFSLYCGPQIRDADSSLVWPEGYDRNTNTWLPGFEAHAKGWDEAVELARERWKQHLKWFELRESQRLFK